MYFFHTAEQRSSKSVQEKEINENENSVTWSHTKKRRYET